MASEQLNLRPPSGKNAYRVDAIKIQIDDLDAVADDDLALKIQLAYQDLAGGTLLTIDDNDEILTLSERFSLSGTGTPAGSGDVYQEKCDQIRDSGILYLDGRDFKDVFIVKDQFWANFLNSGQDAAEVFHAFISGHYVKLNQKVIDQLKQGVTLT